MQLHQQDRATADEQRQRRASLETARVACALSISPEQAVTRREQSTLEWADWITTKMVEYRADDPMQVLPQLCAKIEERCAVISYETSKIAADQIIRERLGKALK